jgi:Flp pilus assembly pilin Flp
MNQRGQTAAEYILLVALGLVVLMVGITVALQLQGISSSVSARVALEENNTIAMLVN